MGLVVCTEMVAQSIIIINIGVFSSPYFTPCRVGVSYSDITTQVAERVCVCSIRFKRKTAQLIENQMTYFRIIIKFRKNGIIHIYPYPAVNE